MPMKLQLCALLALLLTAPVRAQQTAAPAASAKAPSTTSGESTQADASYVIGAQDVLDISVWKDAELTRVVPVRPDGKISLPLLNDVQAAGLTPEQLKQNITDGLKTYLGDPVVTVIVKEMNSQRVYITGEVTKAGAYPLLPNMTILQALSSAGGFTQFANLSKIYMFRMVDGKQVNFPFNYKNVIHGKDTSENVVLKSGDTIVVP
jgi:polysaccharide export outer membrane protein